MTPDDHQGTCPYRACNSHLEKKTARARLPLRNEPPPSVSPALSWVHLLERGLSHPDLWNPSLEKAQQRTDNQGRHILRPRLPRCSAGSSACRASVCTPVSPSCDRQTPFSSCRGTLPFPLHAKRSKKERIKKGVKETKKKGKRKGKKIRLDSHTHAAIPRSSLSSLGPEDGPVVWGQAPGPQLQEGAEVPRGDLRQVFRQRPGRLKPPLWGNSGSSLGLLALPAAHLRASHLRGRAARIFQVARGESDDGRLVQLRGDGRW